MRVWAAVLFGFLSACNSPPARDDALASAAAEQRTLSEFRAAFEERFAADEEYPEGELTDWAVDLGQAICDAYEDGSTPEDVASLAAQEYGQSNMRLVGTVDELATTILCPEAAP